MAGHEHPERLVLVVMNVNSGIVPSMSASKFTHGRTHTSKSHTDVLPLSSVAEHTTSVQPALKSSPTAGRTGPSDPSQCPSR